MISPTGFFLLLCAKITALTWHFILFLLVHGASEGVSEGDGGEEHLDADDEVLPARRHCAGADFVSIDEQRVGYDAAALQDGQDHSYEAGEANVVKINAFVWQCLYKYYHTRGSAAVRNIITGAMLRFMQ